VQLRLLDPQRLVNPFSGGEWGKLQEPDNNNREKKGKKKTTGKRKVERTSTTTTTTTSPFVEASATFALIPAMQMTSALTFAPRQLNVNCVRSERWRRLWFLWGWCSLTETALTFALH